MSPAEMSVMARKAKPMTQEELAEVAGVSVKTVRRHESGMPISAKSARAIAAALGMLPDAMLAPHDLVPGQENTRVVIDLLQTDRMQSTWEENWCRIRKNERSPFPLLLALPLSIGMGASLVSFHWESWHGAWSIALHSVAVVLCLLAVLVCAAACQSANWPSWSQGMSRREKMMEAAWVLLLPAAGIAWLLHWMGAGTLSSPLPILAASILAVSCRMDLDRLAEVRVRRSRQSAYMKFMREARSTLALLRAAIAMPPMEALHAADAATRALLPVAWAAGEAWTLRPLACMVEDMSVAASAPAALATYLSAYDRVLALVVPAWERRSPMDDRASWAFLDAPDARKRERDELLDEFKSMERRLVALRTGLPSTYLS